jgi:hypothetical protein
MTITRFEQSDSFAECCCAFKKLAVDYAFLSMEKDSFLIFHTKSAIAKVIDSIANVIEKTISSISFPNISLDQKLIFIKQCDEFYADLRKIIIMRLKDKNKMVRQVSALVSAGENPAYVKVSHSRRTTLYV